MSGAKKEWADLLSEDLASIPQPEGFSDYMTMLRKHRPNREPLSIKQSPENLRPLNDLEGKGGNIKLA
jgi:hypothetical protein